jgi:SRSO17 transposase
LNKNQLNVCKIQKNDLNLKIQQIVKDPYQTIKNSTKKRESRTKRKIVRSKIKEAKEKIVLSSKVLKNQSNEIC